MKSVSMLVLVLAALSGWQAVAARSAGATDLLQMRAGVRDGVLKFSDELFEKYSKTSGRDYDLVVFLTANQVMDNPQLQMGALRGEYGLASKAFAKGPDSDKIFFVEMVYEESPRVFHAIQANTVPYIFRLSPKTRGSLKSMDLARDDKMTFENQQGVKYPWPAEHLVEFFSGRTGLAAAEVHRPSIVKSPLFPFIVFGFIVTTLYSAYKLMRSQIIRHPAIWAVGALAVFWFSVSGGMFNIIRGMPLFIRDRNGKLQFFLNSRNAQLGAEGFIIGSGYLAISLAVAALTLWVPRMQSKAARTACGYAFTLLSIYAIIKVFEVWMAKTGYRITSYLL